MPENKKQECNEYKINDSTAKNKNKKNLSKRKER